MTLTNERQVNVPPLKWAGGKRWLVGQYPDFFRGSYRTYIEPFLGSGAVFFHLSPRHALLSDSNQELMDFYAALRDSPKEVAVKLAYHASRHNSDYYYEVRTSKPRSISGKAARFLYLNRACWNGLYRVNKSGEFNVPIGTKTKVVLNTDNFEQLGAQLKLANLLCGDFEETIEKSVRGDFMFVDPPYTVAHNANGFLKYNEKIFSWDDQVRLSLAVRRAVSRGVRILLTNAAHPSLFDLYEGLSQQVLTRSSVIAGKSHFRGRYSELIVRA